MEQAEQSRAVRRKIIVSFITMTMVSRNPADKFLGRSYQNLTRFYIKFRAEVAGGRRLPDRTAEDRWEGLSRKRGYPVPEGLEGPGFGINRLIFQVIMLS